MHSNPPSLASETTPTLQQILDVLDEAAEDESRMAFSNYDNAEDVLRWLAVALPSLLADRDRVDAANEIFAWLLGESGDFPESIPGRRYGFRSELRKRLDAARLRPERPEGAE